MAEPEQWRWSSFRFYLQGEQGLVTITQYDQLPRITPDLKTRIAAGPFTHSTKNALSGAPVECRFARN